MVYIIIIIIFFFFVHFYSCPPNDRGVNMKTRPYLEPRRTLTYLIHG
jgi:hypothetical protein